MAVALKLIRDSVTVARARLAGQARARTWFVAASSTGFFMVAPLVFLGETVVGKGGERLEPFFSLSGYTNYTGYLAVPLVFAFLTNSAYSWIGQAIRNEQTQGTLERTLISMRHPSAFIVGGALAHLTFLGFFIVVGIVSVSLVVDLDLNINWWSAIVISLLHLYAVYGFAFVLSSLFLVDTRCLYRPAVHFVRHHPNAGRCRVPYRHTAWLAPSHFENDSVYVGLRARARGVFATLVTRRNVERPDHYVWHIDCAVVVGICVF